MVRLGGVELTHDARRERALETHRSCGEGGAMLLRTALPSCSIRRRCGWFAQTGAAACAVCPVVAIRDVPQERCDPRDG